MPKKTVKICKIDDCKNEQTTSGFCRFHYLVHWKEVQEKKKKVEARKLENFVNQYANTSTPGPRRKRGRPPKNQASQSTFEEAFKETPQKEDSSSDGDFHDIMEEVNLSNVAERVAIHLKIDETF